MAVTIAILPSYTRKVDNQDTARRNLTTEYFDITWDNSATYADFTTKLKTVLEVSAVQTGGTVGTIAIGSTDGLTITSAGVIRLTPSSTPAATIKHRIALTGLSY